MKRPHLLRRQEVGETIADERHVCPYCGNVYRSFRHVLTHRCRGYDHRVPPASLLRRDALSFVVVRTIHYPPVLTVAVSIPHPPVP